MRKFWTPEEINYLKVNFANTSNTVLATQLNRTYSAIAGQAGLLGLHKSEEFKNSPLSGRLRPGTNQGGRTKFKPGQHACNKSKKLGKEWTKGNMAKTQFTKGQIPHNTKADGSITVRNCKGRPYKYKRMAKGVWRELHRLIWEQANGPIPKGFNVQFRDKNSLNCSLDNLYLIDRRNQMKENTIHNYPIELKKTIHVLSKLKRKIKHYEKHN
jgi:hypothetical protein